MKVKIVSWKSEGFLSGLGLEFEGGLVLRAQEKLLWCGSERKEEIRQEMLTLAKELEDKGFEITGKENLDESI